jgi:hypothetical protein
MLPDAATAPISCYIAGSPQTVAEMRAWAHVGRVASISGSIDQLLDDILWTLAKVDHELGACLTSQFSSNYNRFVALEALMRLYGVDKKFLEELNKLSNKSKGLSDRRNRIVHDPLAYHKDTQSMFVMRIAARAQAGLRQEQEPVDLDDYHNAGNDLQVFLAELTRFRDRLFAALPPFD